jgi:hypothetical protein
MRSHSKKEPRRALVNLSPDHVRKLLRGDSLHIRLRTFTGEEQIVEMRSPCHTPQTKSVMARFDDMMEKFDEMMQIFDGKGATNAASKRRNKQ